MHRVVVEGPWSWFNSTVYRQAWAEKLGNVTGSVSKPRAVLFMAPDGVGRVTTVEQIKLICDVAAAAGAPFSVPAMAGGITPPWDEQINITCAQAVARCLAYHPHAALWFDYSAETPALKYAQRTGLAQKPVAVTSQSELSIRQRTDLVVPAVAIYYEQQHTVDGEARPQTVRDLYPPDADPYADSVLSAVFDLRGNRVLTVSQLIRAEQFPVNFNSVQWWTARVPWLGDYTTVSITGGKRLYDTNLSNLLVEGVRQEWMNVGIERERVQCVATCVLKDGFGNIVSRVRKVVTLEVMATGAAIGDTLYRSIVDVEDGEEIPAGVAQSLFAEWSQPHYEGSLKITGEEPGGGILPGDSLNITGGRAEWAAMRAMVVRVEESVDEGETRVEFGPAAWLDVNARVLFERSARSRQFAASARMVSGAVITDGIRGASPATELRDGETAEMVHNQMMSGFDDAGKVIDLDPDSIVPADGLAAGAKEVPWRAV